MSSNTPVVARGAEPNRAWLRRALCVFLPLLAGCIPGALSAARAEEPLIPVSPELQALDRGVNWNEASLLTILDANRFKTLDTYARERLYAMIGSEHFPGLSPVASLLEWLFNRELYADVRVIKIRDLGIRIHLSAHMPEVQQTAMRAAGRMTLREMFSPEFSRKVSELEARFEMGKALNRVREAELTAKSRDGFLAIVPRPDGDADTMWYSPMRLLPNLPDDVLAAAGLDRATLSQQLGPPVAGISGPHAVAILGAWGGLRDAWRDRDVARVQSSLDRLGALLPQFAPQGVYPTHAQRAAEGQYYRFGKFTWGYWLYLLASLVSVFALVTGWRTPWLIALVLGAVALGLHTYGIGLRWFILGRIPIANMFEAITFAAWASVAVGLVIELAYPRRVMLVATNVVGFLALVLANFVLPGATLSNMMGILDDVMLRIHTVCITISYVLVALAAIIGIIYLIGYYGVRHAARAAECGLLTALVGVAMWWLSTIVFRLLPEAGTVSGFVRVPGTTTGFLTVSLVAAALLTYFVIQRYSGTTITAGSLLLLAAMVLAYGGRELVIWSAVTLLISGVSWSALMAIGMLRHVRLAQSAAPALAVAGGGSVGGGSPELRPILAGAAPGDERQASLPGWLNAIDWSHLIVLNLIFVLLFVGTILGAVWADYSWGRPWGWDPKEVFAMNTWLIYAILIHARFITSERGLWTAWLSIGGCAMMAFNWYVVNFFIVGIHSYA